MVAEACPRCGTVWWWQHTGTKKRGMGSCHGDPSVGGVRRNMEAVTFLA